MVVSTTARLANLSFFCAFFFTQPLFCATCPRIHHVAVWLFSLFQTKSKSRINRTIEAASSNQRHVHQMVLIFAGPTCPFKFRSLHRSSTFISMEWFSSLMIVCAE
ncbi:hypothetical protein KP509_07G060100 [Ceratopteris richardii]|uniref:Secreted protein n=1 Tax=Ceratopteris richardii TaxID=49495 RepID=A0A8T2UCS3_CERRI|nr:hypothetical protein KP509_07G060100 [Ceratopteris richardii]